MEEIQIKENFYKKLIYLATPIALSQLLSSLLQVFDTFMVSGLGDNAVSAVGIGAQYNFLMIMILFGLFSGFGVFYAQFWGSKEYNNIQKVFIISIILGLIISILFTLFAIICPDVIVNIFINENDLENITAINEVTDMTISYLKIVSFSYIFTSISFTFSMLYRSIEKVIYPNIISIITVTLNAILNYILINGYYGFPELGVKGAATATLISSIMSSVLLLFYALLSKQDVLKIKSKLVFNISKDFIVKIFEKVLPVAINETLWGLGMTTYLIAFGNISTNAIGTAVISNQINSVFWVLGIGVANASGIMIGKKLGEANFKTAKEWGKRFIYIGIFLGVFVGILLFISAPSIVNIFDNLSSEVKHNVIIILRIYSLYAPIKFFNAIHIVGTLRAGGDTKYALKAEIIPLWGIGVPLAFILAIFTGLSLPWIIVIINIEEIIKFIALFKRFCSYKWVNNLT